MYFDFDKSLKSNSYKSNKIELGIEGNFLKNFKFAFLVHNLKDLQTLILFYLGVNMKVIIGIIPIFDEKISKSISRYFL